MAESSERTQKKRKKSYADELIAAGKKIDMSNWREDFLKRVKENPEEFKKRVEDYQERHAGELTDEFLEEGRKKRNFVIISIIVIIILIIMHLLRFAKII